VILPILAPLIASERAEVLFLAASLIVSGLTLLAARRRVHTCWTPVGIFGIAALLLVAIRTMGIVEQPMGAVLVVVAASLITGAHCANIRCCRRATGPTPLSSSTITRIAVETTP
jgi:hypothetical protein